jgi:hypothetical protein
MKRMTLAPMRLLATVGLLLVMGLGSVHPVQAQATKDRGQEAQAGFDGSGQVDGFVKLRGEAKSTSGPGIHDASAQWDQKWMQKFRPQKPQKPIPVVLIVLGALMVFLWTLLLLGVVFAASAGLAVILFILLLVFIPVLVIGIIFIIGGIVAAASGGRPPQAMRR